MAMTEAPGATPLRVADDPAAIPAMWVPWSHSPAGQVPA